MKVEVIEAFKFPPALVFSVLADIPHHVDWMQEPLELVSLIDGPAKLGTTWEQNADRAGKKLVTLNTCNIYEENQKFGWVSKKPFLTQVTLTLEPIQASTNLTWIVESDGTGIVQMAEPMLLKQTKAMMRTSLMRLKTYLQDKNL